MQSQEILKQIMKEQEKILSISQDHLCELMVKAQNSFLFDSGEEDYSRPEYFIPVKQIEKIFTVKETSTVLVKQREKGYFSASDSPSPFEKLLK